MKRQGISMKPTQSLRLKSGARVYFFSRCRDEERFGLEYDLDVYNIVAVSDFNMGGVLSHNFHPNFCLNSAQLGFSWHNAGECTQLWRTRA